MPTKYRAASVSKPDTSDREPVRASASIACALLACEQSRRRLLLISGDAFLADPIHPMRLADPPQAVEALNRARIAALHITAVDLADNVTGIVAPLGVTVRA